ncbi:MAG: nucleotide sugar dehydrogenase, partial [Bacteroidetes bacterium]|nr:nucleotide sugar dehydrogenase [Bacteroidota bacterium]
VPVLEKVSGLKFNTDFFVGYSPERVNPGDKEHTIPNVVKITSGSTLETANFVDALYRSIVKAGTCKVTSIKVAEAAKVIENAQRDVNIAFVNELAKMFNRMHISTNEVLEAAGTKWNFFKFKPGLVGGHCVSVDPYYLAQKAQNSGYYPELIVTARKLNNSMGEYVARQVIQAMIGKEINPKNAKILVLGVTFKENCADVRNTKIVDIVDTLKEYHASVTICDPLADPNKLMREYGLKSTREVSGLKDFDAVILAVAHREFAAIDIPSLCKSKRVIYDVKNLLPNEIVDARL